MSLCVHSVDGFLCVPRGCLACASMCRTEFRLMCFGISCVCVSVPVSRIVLRGGLLQQGRCMGLAQKQVQSGGGGVSVRKA